MHAKIHSGVELGSLRAFAVDGTFGNAVIGLAGESLRATQGIG